MLFGSEFGSNLGGTTLQLLLKTKLRSDNLIIMSVVLSLFLILSLLLILNLLGSKNLTLGINWWITTTLRLILDNPQVYGIATVFDK